MQKNLLSESIADTDFTVLMQHLADFERGFSFLQTLSLQDAHVHKMGNKSVAYVDACVTAATTFPSYIPSNINTTELLKDKQLFDQLNTAITKLSAVLSVLENGKLALAQDLMQPCDRIYQILKLAAKNDSAVKPSVEVMGKRYQRKSKPKAST